MVFKTDYKSWQLFVVAFQESLIALAPYIILVSLLLLMSQLMRWQNLNLPGLDNNDLNQLISWLRSFISIAIVLSLAYHFAQRYEVEQTVALLLSVAIYASLLALDPFQSAPQPHPGVSPAAIIIPITSVLLLRGLQRRFSLKLSCDNGISYTCRFYCHVYSFLLAYILLLSGIVLIAHTVDWFVGLTSLSLSLPAELLLLLRSLLIHVLWFFGLHGPHMLNSLLSTDFLHQEFVTGLSYWDLYRVFAINGGSGMGLSLLIAIYITGRTSQIKQIARLSTPFVVFNINTLIIYALPVVLNRYLLVPFLLLPLINTALALLIIPWIPVSFTGQSVTWTTPVFIDTYLLTGGSLLLIPLQATLITLGVVVYLPFLRQFSKSQSSYHHISRLSRNLGIASELKAREGLTLYKAQRSIIESNLRLRETIGMLSDDDLMVYYQPKVDLNKGCSASFEALLRLRKQDGQIVGPFFLTDIETSGLSPVLDLWVCKRVLNHLKNWKAQGFVPIISINIHPDTLQDRNVVKQITEMLRGWPIEFEILERAFVEGDKAIEQLHLLKHNGFRIAIDDFGVGYSSYDFISSFDIDTIKLDKTLIDRIDERKGYLVCKHAFILARDLGCDCIAEGVETWPQIERLQLMGARFVQGWYFAPALPIEDAMNFRPHPLPIAKPQEIRKYMIHQE